MVSTFEHCLTPTDFTLLLNAIPVLTKRGAFHLSEYNQIAPLHDRMMVTAQNNRGLFQFAANDDEDDSVGAGLVTLAAPKLRGGAHHKHQGDERDDERSGANQKGDEEGTEGSASESSGSSDESSGTDDSELDVSWQDGADEVTAPTPEEQQAVAAAPRRQVAAAASVMRAAPATKSDEHDRHGRHQRSHNSRSDGHVKDHRSDRRHSSGRHRHRANTHGRVADAQ
jgi:hypothetical protein